MSFCVYEEKGWNKDETIEDDEEMESNGSVGNNR